MGRLDQHTAREGLPHPLAVLYARTIEPDPARRLKATLAFVEGCARFLACCAIADATAAGLRGRALADLARGLSKGFGTWLHVIDTVARDAAASKLVLGESLKALVASPAWVAFVVFKDLRNDEAHGRVSVQPAGATALLLEHASQVQDVLDGVGFLVDLPLGVLRGVRHATDGRAIGDWFACRGPYCCVHQTNLEDVAGMPSDQLLLIDPMGRCALTLAPIMAVIDDCFVWIDDLPPPEGGRPTYVRPTPGEQTPVGTPSLLYTPSATHTQGSSFEEWMVAPERWNRRVDVGISTESLERMSVQMSGATKPNGSGGSPAAVREGTRRVQVVLALLLPVLLLIVAAVGWSALSHEHRVPGERPNRDIPARLSTYPELRNWILRWSAVAGNPSQGSLQSAQAMYADNVSFHGHHLAWRPDAIFENWVERHANGRFEADVNTATWYEPEATDSSVGEPCRSVQGALPGVIAVRIRAIESGAPLGVVESNAGECHLIRGPYLLWLRRVQSTFVICHESWSLNDALCSSCPMAYACTHRQ